FAEARDMAQLLGLFPWAVIDLALDGEGEGAVLPGEQGRAGRRAAPAIGADLGRDPRLVEAVDRGDIGRAREREVTAVCAIWAFAEVLARHDLRNEAVEIEIALAVAMA